MVPPLTPTSTPLSTSSRIAAVLLGDGAGHVQRAGAQRHPPLHPAQPVAGRERPDRRQLGAVAWSPRRVGADQPDRVRHRAPGRRTPRAAAAWSAGASAAGAAPTGRPAHGAGRGHHPVADVAPPPAQRRDGARRPGARSGRGWPARPRPLAGRNAVQGSRSSATTACSASPASAVTDSAVPSPSRRAVCASRLATRAVPLRAGVRRRRRRAPGTASRAPAGPARRNTTATAASAAETSAARTSDAVGRQPALTRAGPRRRCCLPGAHRLSALAGRSKPVELSRDPGVATSLSTLRTTEAPLTRRSSTAPAAP